ncbi:MAG: hypothetical protein DBY10_02195 [Clostridiales bacterium]|jgi:putative membrane protein|nr:MAG: hypothetical protein DBY10_02195 [Clostridiales bacterium]
MAREPIPVYMICGFLDAGKTNFIAPMLTGEEFTEDERTLLLVCEEGEEEYDTEALGKHNVVPIFLEGKEDLTLSRMEALEAEYRPTQIVVEYNGMWQIAEAVPAFPRHWDLYQIVTIVESPTFNSYAKNMASLMMEKLREADLIVFNRCTDELAEVLRQRNLKMLNRRAEMYLEYAGDEDRMENYDNGLCPFDLSVPVLELSDDDYGFWYTDCMDNPERYAGKTVKFRGIVAQSPKFPHGMYAAGRFGMVCCAEDTAFLGMLCSGPEHKQLKTKDWVEITAKVRLKNLKLLGGEGPVLYTTNVTPCAAPADPLIYF